MDANPKTIDITPNVDGLVRWLRCVYQTDPKNAMRILGEGWPAISARDAVHLLEGRISLSDALGVDDGKAN